MSRDEPIRMLMLDDKTLTTSLDRAGYREMGVLVSSAASSQEAQEVLRNKAIDILVINLDYPGVDAESLCRQIRHNAKWKELPIVLTSVQARAAYRKAAIDAGANLFVEQPIPRTYFIEKLKQLLTKETRATGRVASEQLNQVRVVIDGESREYPIGDLSNSGMLISTPDALAIGCSLSLEFDLPGQKKPLQATGEVVRHVGPSPKNPDRPQGVGVRFVAFTGDSEKRLHKYLTSAKLDSKEMLYYL